MMDPELVPLAAARFRALGEPGRLLILQALQGGERSVGELVEDTGRSQPNVSQHLAHLAKAGLVATRRDGSRVYYRVVDPFLARICDAVCDSLSAQARGEARRLQGIARIAPRAPRARAAAARPAARGR
jgi:DNA-binding transcriptional ArsR family regulator